MSPHRQPIFAEALTAHQSGDLRGAEALYRTYIETNEGDPQALANLGFLLLQRARLDEAEVYLSRALMLAPRSKYVKGYFAKLYEAKGLHSQAVSTYSEILAEYPNDIPSLLGRANRRLAREEWAAALTDLANAYQQCPNLYETNYLLGMVRLKLGDAQTSVGLLATALEMRPESIEARLTLATALEKLNRAPDALKHLEQGTKYSPRDYALFASLGVLNRRLRRLNEARLAFEEAVRLQQNNADAWSNLGVAQWDMRMHEQAIRSLNKAIKLNPAKPAYFYNRGNVYLADQRFEEAESDFFRSIELEPTNAAAYNNLANLLKETKRSKEALRAYSRAVELCPTVSRFVRNRGIMFREMDEYAPAIEDLQQAYRLDPNYDFLVGDLIHTKTLICDWSQILDLLGVVNDSKRSGLQSPPFPSIGFIDLAEVQRSSANAYQQKRFNFPTRPLAVRRTHESRLRLGYYSTDYHNHATAHLMARFFELHDRSKFEVHAFSFGPVRDDAMRRRLMNAFEHFHEVSQMSDREVAMLSRKLGIDIAFDLKGYTQNSRPGIFGERCAPVQISFIGYPGTMGSPYIDYLIADKVVIPEESQKFYTEKILYMPRCYQVNDNQREVSSHVFTRKELGLPENGFVFCSFNNNYKILPAMFDCWMAILKQVPGSVLWIFKDNDLAEANLRKEARARGVEDARLIFAARMPTPEHLARHRCADLFLDTFPCSAHTTASDALYMGLPMVTLAGETFASRVAASLLTSLKMPALIASTMEEYQSKVLTLATQPQTLQRIKQALLDTMAREETFGSVGFYDDFEKLVLGLEGIEEAVDKKSQSIEHEFQAGFQAHAHQDLATAEKAYISVLKRNPNHYDAMHMLGLIRYKQGRYQEAKQFILGSMDKHREDAPRLSNLGLAHRALGEVAEAITSFKRALAIAPDFAAAYNNLGEVLFSQGLHSEACESYLKAIQLNPSYAEAWYNLGNAYADQKLAKQAEECYRKALHARPSYLKALTNLGTLLYRSSRFLEAIEVFRAALQSTSLDPEGRSGLQNNLAESLRSVGRIDEAEKFFKASLQSSSNAMAYLNLGHILSQRGDQPGASLYYSKAYEIAPNDFLSGSYALQAKMAICDWSDYAKLLKSNSADVSSPAGVQSGMPFSQLSLIDDPRRHFEVASQHALTFPGVETFDGFQKKQGTRLSIGYFSADFQVHPVAQLIAGVFEHHDKSRFEVIAFSYGPDKVDDMRQRLLKSFDRFIEVREKSDEAVATMCREMGLDIAIDLSGYTFGARTGIFAQRCAPVQINYLGYPGTMGASFYDYIIADEVIIPPELEQYYSEKVLRLPHCYQPNDRSRKVSDRVFTREELGLPKEGFVYCCFNNNYKILPETFDSWMRILKAVPGSVLWLLEDNAKASENLKKEAQSRGVDPSRLIFAPRMALPDHLARHKLADLFLDTFPYNAHTTASDALWVGLPILTRMGKSFASRVAASISKAAGLTELTTQTTQQYEDLAIALAQAGSPLPEFYGRLARTRLQLELYDVGSQSKAWSSLLSIFKRTNN